jgi:hypothetical protein
MALASIKVETKMTRSLKCKFVILLILSEKWFND